MANGNGIPRPQPRVNPMQGFTPEDILAVKPEDFIEAADTLIENGGESNKRVANILRVMATEFKKQEEVVKQFEQAKAKGQLKPL